MGKKLLKHTTLGSARMHSLRDKIEEQAREREEREREANEEIKETPKGRTKKIKK